MTDDLPDSPLLVQNGRTAISQGVVATICRTEAAVVPGVFQVGAAGALGRVRGALSSTDTGVDVEVGQVQTAVTLTLIAEYGVPLMALSEDVRERVIRQVEDLTGLQVIELDIAVADIHLDDQDQL